MLLIIGVKDNIANRLLKENSIKVHKGFLKAYTKDGKPVTLNIFVDIINVGTSEDSNSEVDGMKELMTTKGQKVNYIEKGKYQIVETGETLTSDDPQAP